MFVCSLNSRCLPSCCCCCNVQTVANNFPDDIYVDSYVDTNTGVLNNGTVTSAGTPGAWALWPSPYFMLATIAQCAAEFSNGINNTCYACTAADWNAASCSCNTAVGACVCVCVCPGHDDPLGARCASACEAGNNKCTCTTHHLGLWVPLT